MVDQMKAATTISSPPKDATKAPECRPLEEFQGENRELFLRFFLHFGAALLKDFKTGNPQIDAENEDGDGERFQLEWLLTRAFFASYVALELLGIKPDLSETAEFTESL
jgi:hypothetical protein